MASSRNATSRVAAQVRTLEAAMDAIVAGANDTGAQLYMAQQHLPGTAAALAGGSGAGQQDMFAS